MCMKNRLRLYIYIFQELSNKFMWTQHISFENIDQTSESDISETYSIIKSYSPETHASMSHSIRLGGDPLLVTSVATKCFKLGINFSTSSVSMRWDARINNTEGKRIPYFIQMDDTLIKCYERHYSFIKLFSLNYYLPRKVKYDVE